MSDDESAAENGRIPRAGYWYVNDNHHSTTDGFDCYTSTVENSLKNLLDVASELRITAEKVFTWGLFKLKNE